MEVKLIVNNDVSKDSSILKTKFTKTNILSSNFAQTELIVFLSLVQWKFFKGPLKISEKSFISVNEFGYLRLSLIYIPCLKEVSCTIIICRLILLSWFTATVFLSAGALLVATEILAYHCPISGRQLELSLASINSVN